VSCLNKGKLQCTTRRRCHAVPTHAIPLAPPPPAACIHHHYRTCVCFPLSCHLPTCRAAFAPVPSPDLSCFPLSLRRPICRGPSFGCTACLSVSPALLCRPQCKAVLTSAQRAGRRRPTGKCVRQPSIQARRISLASSYCQSSLYKFIQPPGLTSSAVGHHLAIASKHGHRPCALSSYTPILRLYRTKPRSSVPQTLHRVVARRHLSFLHAIGRRT
jgi:hypothetical protein